MSAPEASASGTGPNKEFAQSAEVPLHGGSGAGTQVEADDSSSDYDSSVSTGASSATTSVTSSVFSFTYANGRRYHSDRFQKADYFLPNDEAEQDRLDLYHHIFLSLLGGKLHTAPLDKSCLHRVLDVGTGTGLWAIDFADENQQAEVIGTDISPIQPHWTPPNVKFEVEDMEEVWTYKDNYFDYIHIRSLSGSFRDWDRVLEQCYEKLAPGGYLEFQDYGCQFFLPDGTHLDHLNEEIGAKYPIAEYMRHTILACERQGRPLLICPGMKARMEKAGFVDCVAQTSIWPLGPWPKDKQLKELGRWGQMGALDSLFPFGVHLLTKEGWSIDRVKALCDRTDKGFREQKYYTYGWFIYGRKPGGKDQKRKPTPEATATATTTASS